jgi:hypothetical protein
MISARSAPDHYATLRVSPPILASINKLSENSRTTCINIVRVRKTHMGPCIIGRRQESIHTLKLAHLQNDAEAAAQRGTLRNLLELDDDDITRPTRETSMI